MCLSVPMSRTLNVTSSFGSGLADCGDKPAANVVSVSYGFNPDLHDDVNDTAPVLRRQCTEFGKVCFAPTSSRMSAFATPTRSSTLMRFGPREGEQGHGIAREQVPDRGRMRYDDGVRPTANGAATTRCRTLQAHHLVVLRVETWDVHGVCDTPYRTEV